MAEFPCFSASKLDALVCFGELSIAVLDVPSVISLTFKHAIGSTLMRSADGSSNESPVLVCLSAVSTGRLLEESDDIILL